MGWGMTWGEAVFFWGKENRAAEMVRMGLGILGCGGVKQDEGVKHHIAVCVICGYKSMHEGLISEDRSNKATLLLTTPREF